MGGTEEIAGCQVSSVYGGGGGGGEGESKAKNSCTVVARISTSTHMLTAGGSWLTAGVVNHIKTKGRFLITFLMTTIVNNKKSEL